MIMRSENSLFKLPDFYDDLLTHSIFISGLPRSGTTLLGKIVGSFSDLEYHFEYFQNHSKIQKLHYFFLEQ